MQFLNPWLLAGLAGISVPVVIHLMNRFRSRDVDWAAMDLLRKVLVVRSRRIRIEDLILLLLRCAIIGLLALAIARPTLTSKDTASWIAGRADVGAVIAVDASFSMEHKPGVYSRFDRAMERVQEVCKTLNPGDPLTIVLLGDKPRVLFRNSGYEGNRVSNILEKASPLSEGLNLEVCLAEVEQLLGEIKAPARECYLVTDAQSLDWQQLSETSRASLERIATDSRVFFLPVAGGQSENLAITRFEQVSGMVRQGALARYVAAVSNTGQQPRERVPVTFYAGDTVVDQRIVPKIEPGKTELVPMLVRFDQPGALRLAARIGDDDLLIDNARFVVANVRSKVRVLCVEGTPSVDLASGGSAKRSEVLYLLKSLASEPAQDKGKAVAIDRVSWLDLSSRKLADYDIIVLVDVAKLQEDQVTAIGQFVSGGGGLISFLGPNIESSVLNENMQFEDKPLLPGTILAAVGDASDRKQGKAITPTAGHPLARGMASLPEIVMAQPRVYQFFPVELGAESRAVVQVGTEPTEVLIAEKSLGRGTVVLFTSTADRKWTDMVAHPSYPIWLNDTISQLGRRSFERPLRVGESLVLPLPLPINAVAPENVICVEPGDSQRKIKTARRDGQIVADIGTVDRAGFYDVRYAKDAGLPLAVNVDAAESDVRCLEDRAIDESLRGTKVTIVPRSGDLTAAIRQGRIGREFWWELLLLAIVLLLVEAYLASRFTERIVADPGHARPVWGGALFGSAKTENRGQAYNA
jgi:hypothetical protein